ncbi:MAG: hypothetical protein Q4E39_04820 [bacterium]|nr:hypothetical protein [bacterium]
MGLLNKKKTKKEPKVIRMKNGRFVKKEEYDRIINESKKKPKIKKEKIKESKKEKTNEEKRKIRMIMIILFLLLLFLLFILDIDDLILGIPTEPKVKIPKDKWYQTKVVKIEEDAKSRKKISHYLYCIRQDSNIEKCEWNRTDTKSIEVSKSGINHIWFKGVTEDGKEGKPSKETIVKIDNEAPEEIKVKKTVTETTIKVKVEVKDKETKIEKYYYKIDDKEFEESEKTDHTFKSLKPGTTYKITIKVVDSLGNEKELILNITTKKENKEEDTNLDNKDNQNNNQKDKNKENNQTSESTDNNGKKEETKKEDDNKEEEVEEIPELNLSGVPKKFEVGESYKLPTSYKFGKSGGKVSCTVDSKEYKDTKDLGTGIKLIKCSAKSNKGVEVRVEKEVEIVQKDIKEETWDGWITMNLYYPESSTDWQWRLGSEEDTRDDGWSDYTGPITVRLTDVENVYIRYKLKSGEVVIVPPTGKLVVDIEPTSYEVTDGKTTKVKITYTKDADKKQYKINDGEWTDYTGEFSVGNDTRIEARVIKTTKEETKRSYDSVYIRKYVESETGESSTIKSGTRLPGESAGTYETESNPSYGSNYRRNPSYMLEGPEIIKDTEEIVDSIKVEVKPQKKAKKIYYKAPEGNWTEYKDVVEVSKIGYFYAKYETEDGQTSNISYIYIDNIDQHKLPNVRIGLNTIERAESVTVSITTNGENLRYSFDGEIYQNYTGSITLKENTRIYAKADNSNGTTTAYRDITNIGKIPVSPTSEEYNIGIFLNPEEKDVKGLVNQTEASIVYDSRCENKYYKIGYNGTYQAYTGKVKITSNSRIYGYCTGKTGKGYTSKNVGFLTTGIEEPEIEIEPTEMAEEVKVEIKYPKNAKIKKYRIGNGNLIDYTESITIDENTTIYAYTEDELKNKNSSERTITNITTLPRYTTLDMGSYFILRLNYPKTSNKDTREYKWSPKGNWKKYNTKGVLLIKNEYKDEIDTTAGVKVKDENGKEIIFTEDYYYVSDITSDISENLFMRWDYSIPKAPTIKLNTTTPTKKVEVTIEYTNSSKKQYKLVNKDGKETEWLDYKEPITIDKNETIVYARGISSIEAIGEIASKKITNIDEENPEVEAVGDFETPTRKLTIQIVGKDNLGINVVGWGKGKKDEKYFQDVASLQKNNSTFTVEDNGIYTIYAEDMVGNTTIKEIKVENIDKTAPEIDINILTKEYGDTLEFEVEYGDSTKKEYKIGEKGTYKTYSGKVSVKANDVLNQVNEDGSLTIYAKGTDKAGNIQEVKEKTYIIDLDAPKVPVINASTGYPILTEYGVEFDDVLSINYDSRDDIDNYISLDGKTWKIYTGVEHITSGTVYAKSVKKTSGLTVETSKKVEQPTDALGPEAYDGDKKTSVTVKGGFANSYRRIHISSEMLGKSVNVISSVYGTVAQLNDNNQELDIKNISAGYGESKTFEIEIVDGARILEFRGGSSSNSLSISEIMVCNQPKISAKLIYPKIEESGISKGYNIITIKYFSTSVKKLYKINDGEWIEYENIPVKVTAGDTIYAKGIDGKNVETEISSYTATLPADALGSKAYDGDTKTYEATEYNKLFYMLVDKSMVGQRVKVLGGVLEGYIKFYNDAGTELGKFSGISKSSGWLSVVVPEGTTKIGTYTDIAEISPDEKPTFTSNKFYPKLTSTGVEKGHNDVTIKYFSTSVKKLYKINDGEWIEYENIPVKVTAGDTIYAKGIDGKNVETEIGSYTAILPAYSLGSKAYDGDTKTYEATKYNVLFYMLVDKSMIGKTVQVLGGTATSGYIKFYNDAGTELGKLLGISKSSGWRTAVVPEGTTKIGTYAYIAEIGPVINSAQAKARKKIIVPSDDNTNNEETITIPNFIPAPDIIVSDSNRYTATKNITISYPSGDYINQYSLDGKNWTNYTGVISIDKETTIFARTLSGEKVISSSSCQITKIDNVKPTISLDEVPNEINIGDDYRLPTTYLFYNNKSGGSIKCLLDDTIEITTTKGIGVGSHNIKCSATTGSGIVSTVEKDINVIDNREQVPKEKDTKDEEEQEEIVKEGEVSEEEKKFNGESTTEESSSNNN